MTGYVASRKAERKSELGERLTILREKLRWNVTFAAFKAKVSTTQISKWELGFPDREDPEIIKYIELLETGEANPDINTGRTFDHRLKQMPINSQNTGKLCKHCHNPYKAEFGGSCATCFKHPDDPTFKQKRKMSYLGQAGIPARQYILTRP